VWLATLPDDIRESITSAISNPRTSFRAEPDSEHPQQSEGQNGDLPALPTAHHPFARQGRAAVVVPTGFITAQSGIDKSIREHLVKNKMLGGVVSMPSNIFATTGTNVFIHFIDATNKGDVILIDASDLGEKIREGKTQKTILRPDEEQKIIETFNAKHAVEDFSVVVSYDDIEAKNYSLSAGQYFDVKIEYEEISKGEFHKRMTEREDRLKQLFSASKATESNILQQLKSLNHEA